MRNIVFRFGSSPDFARALRAGDQELAPPPGESVSEGEWVLAIFEVGERRRATAAASRGLLRDAGPVLAFERRDWERLLDFADASSLSMVSAARPANPGSVPPPSPSEPPPPLPNPSESRIHNRAALGIPGASTATRPSLDRTALGIPAPSTPSVPAVTPPAPSALKPSSPSMPRIAAPTRPSLDRTTLGLPAAPASPLARVLLVDDDKSVCEIVTAMLDAVGLAVESVGHAENALERLRASRYDLVVLDWNLPGMTGLELCRLVRKDPKLAALPVIFLSARTASQDIVDAFASGADDYVSKPFRAPELGARIFGLLRRARMVSELP